MLVVELWPAADRPYIGGSQTNSILELVLGYNGFGRLTGDEVGSVGGGAGTGGGWGETGLTRLFDAEFGGAVAWLLPAALVLLVVLLWRTRRAPRTDPLRAAAVLWGGWLLVTAAVFSLMAGIFHGYYLVALAPAIGALVGIGASVLWRDRERAGARILLAGLVAVTAGWAFVLLRRTPTWLPWLAWVVLGLGLLAAVGMLAVRIAPPGSDENAAHPTALNDSAARPAALDERAVRPTAGAARSAAKGGRGHSAGARGRRRWPWPSPRRRCWPGSPDRLRIRSPPPPPRTPGRSRTPDRPAPEWADGSDPECVPGRHRAAVWAPSPARPASGRPAATGAAAAAPAPAAAADGAASVAAPSMAARSGGAFGGGAFGVGGGFGGGGFGGGPGGGLLGSPTPDAEVVAAVERDAGNYTWAAAAVGSNVAAGYQLATQLPVMAVGGFNGTDPAPTLEEFQQLVAQGRVHWFVGASTGGGRGGGLLGNTASGGSDESRRISEWVAATFTPVTVDGTTLYDLSTAA